MHGFRRTLFLSHLGLVALTLLLLALTLRGLVTNYFAAQMRQQLLGHAAATRNGVRNLVNARGFDSSLKAAQLREVQRTVRRRARRNNIRLQLIARDGTTLFDSAQPQQGPNQRENQSATRGSRSDAPASKLGRSPNKNRDGAQGDDSIADIDSGAGSDTGNDSNSRTVELERNASDPINLALQGETSDVEQKPLTGASPIMFLATPIRRDGEIVGCVLASSPVLVLTPDVAYLARRFALVMTGIFVLAIVFSIALSQRLSLPARRLEEATRRLAAGDLSSRAPLHKRLLGRGDEMDALTREFNRMAEEIERVDEERRAFLADVSHELRTPLCAIKGSAETLRDGAWRDARFAPRFAATIAAQSDRLIRLVGDLLKLARLEAASTSTALAGEEAASRFHQPLAARELCERASSAVAPLFDARGVRHQTECEAIEVRGDADLLEQLLINLLANAARHSPAGSTTTLRLAREGDAAVLQVRDQGCGIAPEHLPKLGRRFYRVEEGRARAGAATTAATQTATAASSDANGSGGINDRAADNDWEGGSGLGLAICRRIALAHGGTLEIESEVGSGTVVTATLPIQ